jgi:hypothetical protein
MSAALPTWFKIQLAEVAAGTRSYFGVGWHLGYHHPDTFDLDEGTEFRDEDFKQPTRMLRRLFASEEHPKADLVDYIPSKAGRLSSRALLRPEPCRLGRDRRDGGKEVAGMRVMRSTTLKRLVLGMVRNAQDMNIAAEALARLPVVAKDEPKKRALVKEVRALAGQDAALYRRMRACADRLDKLPIEKKLVK